MASTDRSDGEGSVYQRHDKGCDKPKDARGKSTCKCTWVAVTVVGWKDKKPIRRKVSAKSRPAALAKMREQRDKLRDGTIPSGRVPTVREWMTYWLETVVPRKAKASTIQSYSTYVNRYIIPLLGDHRIDRLRGEHIEAAWDSLMIDGCPGKAGAEPLSSTSAHQAHVILARALRVAQQRGHLRDLPTREIDPPPVATAEMEVLTHDQARKVITAAQGKRNAARTTVAFSLGLRQGEALGLRWSDVDLESGIMKVRHSLGRVKGQGLVLGDVKSKTGVRSLKVPDRLLAELKAHRVAQNGERLAAGSWWEDNDYVFATAAGKPIDPKADWMAWKLLLAEAKVPDVRLHAARHTAITMLLALGVPPHVVKEIAGHSRFSTTEVYIDRVDDLHVDAAERMNAALWD